MPIAGKQYAAQALPLTLTFINIVNNLDSNETVTIEDSDGTKTLEFLNKCRIIGRKMNSNDSGSLGLHPAVYFYSREGRHKPVSFYAITSLMMDFNKNKDLTNNFIKVRGKFEEILIEYDYLIPQITRKYRKGIDSYINIKNFYLGLINNLQNSITKSEAVNKLISSQFDYLKINQNPVNSESIEKFYKIKSG